jgi:hypothetical protein
MNVADLDRLTKLKTTKNGRVTYKFGMQRRLSGEAVFG